ncbi:MAG: alpha-1,2-fucosyltransferase, partial [Proteobacteria bacterium]|nr:alpha-1,2-fucosyltransferase [Pseudomonadota bacterium]
LWETKVTRSSGRVSFARAASGSSENNNSVALHVRWFDQPEDTAIHNVSADYYQRAIALIDEKIESPHYFLFSDDPEAARAKLTLPEDRVTFVSHNQGDVNAYADLWLMTQCRHFITANSTFSWWGAWLGGKDGAIVICPSTKLTSGTITSWNFEGQIPDGWQKI